MVALRFGFTSGTTTTGSSKRIGLFLSPTILRVFGALLSSLGDFRLPVEVLIGSFSLLSAVYTLIDLEMAVGAELVSRMALGVIFAKTADFALRERARLEGFGESSRSLGSGEVGFTVVVNGVTGLVGGEDFAGCFLVESFAGGGLAGCLEALATGGSSSSSSEGKSSYTLSSCFAGVLGGSAEGCTVGGCSTTGGGSTMRSTAGGGGGAIGRGSASSGVVCTCCLAGGASSSIEDDSLKFEKLPNMDMEYCLVKEVVAEL